MTRKTNIADDYADIARRMRDYVPPNPTSIPASEPPQAAPKARCLTCMGMRRITVISGYVPCPSCNQSAPLPNFPPG